ncbi:MAG TPA: tripartite tricarboxylate transporter substrate binding protein [Ramlibacter sp.]|nr:tripartite tricarboxylate transporter substrate binding protein [Ramlibacter sp.]
MRPRRRLLAALLAAAFIHALPATAADAWPDKPVTLVVPYAAGGGLDTFVRALAPKLSLRWKQPVVIDNRAGGTEVIAAASVIRARPDGYTLFMATDVALETNPFLFSKLPYSPLNDFTLITRLVRGSLVYVVRADSPVRTIQQLVTLGKEQPGKISYGSTGPGGMPHIAMNWFATVSGNTPFLHVPYRGSAPAMQDLLAGQVVFSAGPLSFMEPFIKEGRVRPLAVTAATRLKGLPDVPTLQELGYADTVNEFSFAVVGPPKMPAELASRIAADMGAAVNDPDFLARQVEPFGFVVSTETPPEFTRYLTSVQDKVKARVKAANVQLD